MINSMTTIIDIAKILSDPTRVKIILALYKNGDMCVSEIAEYVDMSQSATSHQLSKLEAKEIVLCYRHGQKMCYELAKNKFTKKLIKILKIIKV